MRPLPPRGMMMSTLSLMVSSMPTAARSLVGTRWMAASGKPAAARPCCRQSRMAPEEVKLSEPPRRMAALPDLRQSPPASAVTLGRLS